MMMFKGTHPTIFFFIVLGIGLIMLLIDYFLRKSELGINTKLLIQILCVAVPFIITFLSFTGRI